MGIKVQCGSCKRQYVAPEKLAGKTVKCSSCGKPVHVPAQASAPQEEVLDLELLEEAVPPGHPLGPKPAAPLQGRPTGPTQTPAAPTQSQAGLPTPFGQPAVPNQPAAGNVPYGYPLQQGYPYGAVSGQPVPPMGQPVTPLGQPIAQFTPPTNPFGQMVTPLGQPVVPLGQQVTPLGQPVTPMGQPITPLGQPFTPLGQPVGAAGQVSPYGQPMGQPLLPVRRKKLSTTAWVAIGGGAVVLLVVVALIVSSLNRKTPTTVADANPSAATGTPQPTTSQSPSPTPSPYPAVSNTNTTATPTTPSTSTPATAPTTPPPTTPATPAPTTTTTPAPPTTPTTPPAPTTPTPPPPTITPSTPPATTPAPETAAAPPKPSPRKARPKATAKSPTKAKAKSAAANWAVTPDPPAEAVEIDPAKKVAVPLQDQVKVEYCELPSPYALLVSNSFQEKGFVVLDLRTSKPAGTFRGEAKLERFPCVSPDGSHVASGDFMAREVTIWSVKPAAELHRLKTPGNEPLKKLCFVGPSQLLMALGTFEIKDLSLWDAESGEQTKELDIGGTAKIAENSLAVSPGGRYVTAFAGRNLVVYEIENGKRVAEASIDVEENGVTCQGASFAPDGSELVLLFEQAGKCRLVSIDFASGGVAADVECEVNRGWNDQHSGTFGSHNVRIEWLADKSAWLFRGQIVDRESGSAIWEMPKEAGAPRVLDGERLLLVQKGDGRAGKQLASIALPSEDIAKATDIVRSGGSAADVTLPPLTPSDASKAQHFSAAGTAPNWEAQPDPAPAAAAIPGRAVVLGKEPSFVREVRFAAPDVAKAVVVRDRADAGQQSMAGRRSRRASAPKSATSPSDQPRSSLERYDLASANLEASIGLPGDYRLLDVTPDGSLALLAHTTEEHKQFNDPDFVPAERLDIWTLNSQKHAIGWRPYHSEPTDLDAKRRIQVALQGRFHNVTGKQVIWAAFVAKNQVLTLNPGGKLILWKLPECQAVYALDDFDLAAGLSPNRKWLVEYRTEGKVLRIYEAATGTCRGELQKPSRDMNFMGGAFEPTGKQFAMYSQENWQSCVTRWDLSTGKIVGEVFLPAFPLAQRGAVSWCDSRYVLVGNTYLVDLDNKMVVWSYVLNGGKHASASLDGRHWYVTGATDHQPGVGRLIGAKLPSEPTRTQTAKTRAEDVAIIYPGTRVNVSVSINVSGTDQAQVQQSIVSSLQANGWLLDQSSPLRLSISASEQSTGETIRYQGHFGSAGSNTVAGKTVKIKLSVTGAPGRPNWDLDSEFKPSADWIVHGDPQAAYDKNLREGFRNYANNLKMPVYLFPKFEQMKIGQSQLTVDGER